LIDHAKEMKAHGFAVLPGWMPPSWSERLVAGLDALWRDRPGQKRLMPHEPFVELLAGSLLDRLVAPVLAQDYLFHHANGKRITDGAGKPWHHDYDGHEPWDGRLATMMIHVMVYPNGVAADNGPLLLRPGTHRVAVPRHQPNQQEYAIRAGDVTVTGPPGTVVLLNSAMWHMRPPCRVDRPRHYLNYSFIGPAAVPRPEREEYTQLLAELPAAAPAGPQRQRLARLCRAHRTEVGADV
jgi:ectoine hydroxylase-related dioxygenase (phytanoyl-CoA dioxygenase family)